MEPLHASTIAAITYLAILIPVPFAASPPTPAAATNSATTSGVVVSEFSPGGGGPFAREFVELHNTGTQTVDLSGWDLLVCLSPTTTQVAVTFAGGTTIAPGESTFVAHADWDNPFGPPPHDSYSVDVPEDGGWLLHDPWSGHADGVGLASGLVCTEGDPAPQCDWDAGVTVARDAVGSDTDDNSVDFVCQNRTPGL